MAYKRLVFSDELTSVGSGTYLPLSGGTLTGDTTFSGNIGLATTKSLHSKIDTGYISVYGGTSGNGANIFLSGNSRTTYGGNLDLSSGTATTGNINFYTGSSATLRFKIGHDGDATFTGNVSLSDSKYIFLGTDSDLQLTHSGTHGNIINHTGNLYLKQNSLGSSQIFMTRFGGGALSGVFEVTDAGVMVSQGISYLHGAGKISLANKTANSNWTGFDIQHNSNNGLDIIKKAYSGASDVTAININSAGAVTFATSPVFTDLQSKYSSQYPTTSTLSTFDTGGILNVAHGNGASSTLNLQTNGNTHLKLFPNYTYLKANNTSTAFNLIFTDSAEAWMGQIEFHPTQTAQIVTRVNQPLAFGVNNSHKMTIGTDGNVTFGVGGSFADKVYFNGRVRINKDGQIHWGSAYNQGYMSWDTNKAIIGGMSSNSLLIQSGGATAITLDTSQNATFSGRVDGTVSGFYLKEGSSNAFSMKSNGANGYLLFRDEYNSADRLKIEQSGHIEISQSLSTGSNATFGGKISSIGVTATHELLLLKAGSGNHYPYMRITRDNGTYHWDVGMSSDSLSALFFKNALGNNALKLDTNLSAHFGGDVSTTGNRYMLYDGTTAKGALGKDSWWTAGGSSDNTTLGCYSGNIKMMAGAGTSAVANVVFNADKTSTFNGDVTFETSAFTLGTASDVARLYYSGGGGQAYSFKFLDTDNTYSNIHAHDITLDGDFTGTTATFGGAVHIMTSDASLSSADANASLIVEENDHTYIELLTPNNKQSGIIFSDGTIAGLINYNHSTNAMTFGTNDGATDVTIDSSGNATFGGEVHITKASPTLTLRQTDTSINQIEMKNSSGSIVGRLKYDTAGGNHMYLENRNAGNLVLETSDIARLTIDGSGNSTFGGTVLIDGLSNYTGLEVKGTGASRPQIKWTNVTNGVIGSIYGTEANALVFSSGTGGATALTLDSSQNATFGGNVGLPTGSVSAPSLYWGTDTNTGIYHSNDNNIRMTINGTKAFELDASRNLAIDGGATFGGKTHIQPASSGATAHSEADNLIIEDSATTGMSILFPSSSKGTLAFGHQSDNDAYTIIADSNNGRMSFSAKHSADLMKFNVGGSQNLELSGASGVEQAVFTGKVGIATATLSSYDAGADNLVVYDSGNAGISIISATTGTSAIHFGDGTGASSYRGYINYSHGSDAFTFATSGSSRLTINDTSATFSGSVYVNSSLLEVDGPNASFHLKNSSDNYYRHYINDGDHNLYSYYNSTLIRAYSPIVGWDIRGAMGINGDVTLNSTNTLKIPSGSSVASLPFCFKDDTNTGMWNPSNNAIGFVTDGAERVNISDTGTVTLSSDLLANGGLNTGTDMNNRAIISYDSGALTLGTRVSSTNYFDVIKLNGTATEFSGQILASNGTASAPAYAFGSQASTGMYKGGTSLLYFSVNGTRKVRVESTQIVLEDEVYCSDTLGVTGNITMTPPTSGGSTFEIRTNDGEESKLIFADNTGGDFWIFNHDRDNAGTSDDSLSISSKTTSNVMNMLQNGKVYFAGNVYSNSVLLTSDKKFKDDVKDIPNALETTSKLRGVSYIDNRDKTSKLGVIAQEVEPIIPEVVSTESHTKYVDYVQLVPMLIESIKELKTEIETLKAKIGE